MSEMTEDVQLYINQTNLWFQEQAMISNQIKRTIQHYMSLTQWNKEQVELHLKRITMGVIEHNEYVKEHGLEQHIVQLEEFITPDHPPGMDLGHKWG